jgi:PadR family transcriptional regulator
VAAETDGGLTDQRSGPLAVHATYLDSLGMRELHGHLDLMLLAVLQSGPLHGYALISELARRSDQAFQVPEGSVYPALQRLERHGWVESQWSNGRRRRRTYALTAAGERHLAKATHEWRRFSARLNCVLEVTA